MVAAYWEIGEQIYKACGENDRAEYGKGLIKFISENLTKEFGKGFDERNLRLMRQFYCAFPIRDSLSPKLSWTHYRRLLHVENEEIRNFCSINYGVNFRIFDKIDVNGKDADPLFKYLKNQTSGILGDSIKWNFTKFLVDAEGNVIKRSASTTEPEKLEEYIVGLIEKAK